MNVDVGVWLVALGILAVTLRPFLAKKIKEKGMEEIDDRVRMFGLFVGGWTLIASGALRLLFVYVLK